MASNKKRIGLDQSSRDTVKDDVWSKIDLMISTLDKPKQPDEFTISDYVNRIESQGNVISVSQAGKQLLLKVKDGTLTTRKTKIKGCKVNVFKFV
jgi:hypothetical protein